MPSDTTRFARPVIGTLAAAAVLTLSACSRPQEDRTIGQQVDAALESTRAAATDAGQEIRQATAGLRQEGREMAETVRLEGRQAGAEAIDKVADAAITASVHADLAKDTELSALRIDVDTSNGHVTLHGTAPTEASRERASRIASTVDGVTSVSNQLVVQ